jgi:CRP-like cAMP-binding protein
MATLTAASHAATATDVLGNRMLASVGADDVERLLGHALLIEASPGDVLYEPGRPCPWVFFPLTSVVSVLTVLDDGSAVETTTIGREGMVGVFHALGDDRNPNGRAVVQMAGRLLRVEEAAFRRAASHDPRMRDALDAYVRAQLLHVTQSVACTAAHSVRQRLARWLLHTTDRVASDDVELTHDFLAQILRVRRASVTVALRELQAGGAVAIRRGGTSVVDRRRLAAEACECYALIRQEYARLIPGEPEARL